VTLAGALTLGIVAWLAKGSDARPASAGAATRAGPPLALFTSLPLYWGDAHDIGSMLGGKAEPHWARAAIEEERRLRPLDTLEAEALDGSRDLLIVQPRPLSPQENVALDAWVARGGRVLLFADPALTEDSAFAIGDPRRHQDVVLLSPILARWGLALEFDEAQPLGERPVRLAGGVALPVNLPGEFALRSGGRSDARCRTERRALIVECAVGKGRVLAVADAALFETAAETPAPRRGALAALLARAFAG